MTSKLSAKLLLFSDICKKKMQIVAETRAEGYLTSMFLPSKLYKIEKISKKLHFFYKNICVYEKKAVILQAFSRMGARLL